MTETFRLERTDVGDFLWAGHRRFTAAQVDVEDITYAPGLVVRRRRAYIDLDSNWSLGLLWSEGSFSDNCTERMAARGGVFIEEPELVEVCALQYGALVVGETVPDADTAMVRAMACELEMLHEDGPAPRWTRGEVLGNE